MTVNQDVSIAIPDFDTLAPADAPVHTTPFFPARVLALMPPAFSPLFEGLQGREIDTAIMAFLASASYVARKCSGLYQGKEVFAPIYALIAGPSGSGKGRAGYAIKLTRDIEDAISQENIAIEAQWKLACIEAKQAGQPQPEKPAQKAAIVGADSTAPYFVGVLDATPEGVLLSTTEGIDIADASKGDYGYSRILLKAAEHEEIRTGRKTTKSIINRCPKVAALITCVPNQLDRIMGDPDNGLFGRFLFYVYDETPELKRDNGDKNEPKMWANYASYCKQISDLPGFDFRFTAGQRDALYNKQHELITKYSAAHGQRTFGIVARLGSAVFRIAMVLERFVIGVKDLPYAICSNTSFEAAILIVECLAAHTFHCLALTESQSILARRPATDAQEKKATETLQHSDFWGRLGETFSTKDYKTAAVQIGVNETTAYRWVMAALGKGIEKDGHGKYRKKAA